MANPQYELGTLIGGIWKQWANAAGQDYYENLSTGAIQYAIPAGYEDMASDTWIVDGSKTWPQWSNYRTGRIMVTDPNPPAPRTYLDKVNVQTHLQLVERSPESHEYLYRRAMMAVLKHFFLEDDGFDVLQEEARGETSQAESLVDLAVLKITARPGGSMYAYDYCLVESKKADISWANAHDHLSRHYGGTENQSQQVYGIIHVGLHIQFFTARRGMLTPFSRALHLRDYEPMITSLFQAMRNRPLPFL